MTLTYDDLNGTSMFSGGSFVNIRNPVLRVIQAAEMAMPEDGPEFNISKASNWNWSLMLE